MRTTKILILSLLSIVFVSCGEFSDDEEEVIKNGRLYNEAIASEFYDTFVDYWNDVIYEELETVVDDFGDQTSDNISTIYSIFGDDFFTDMMVEGQEKKAARIDSITESFNKYYEETVRTIQSRIGTKGLLSTVSSINIAIENFEKGENKEDENIGGTLFGGIIISPLRGYIPDVVTNYTLGAVSWKQYCQDIVNKGTAQNCQYIVLKLMQSWLNKKTKDNITVVYCAPIEDSINSYLVGYSNHRAFQITFLRNDPEKCNFEWQEMVYESANVGINYLD